MGRHWLAWFAIPVLAVAGAGCGNDRVAPTGLRELGQPVSLVNFTAPGGDVSFGRPSTWSVTAGSLPKVAQISSGSAVATVFAYPRTDLPLDLVAAEASRERLLASLGRRAPGFEVESSRVRELSGSPAVEIVGSGRIAGHRVRTKSVHVYKGAAEYVIDAYARPKFFRRAETQAFDPLLATIRLGGFPEGPVSGGVASPR
ncbi:MAG: hypothetical protein ACRDKV_07305 [Solirubrobacterales bacterium]